MIFRLRQYFSRTSSLYNRIVLLILTVSLIFFLFLAFIIFSVSNDYLEKVTLRCGERVARLVDRALQNTMMSSDHSELVQTIDYLCEIPGIQNISIYNNSGEAMHDVTRNIFHPDTIGQKKLLCHQCHASIDTTRWLERELCVFDRDIDEGRELVIVAPVRNVEGCSSASCHVADANNELLGFLEIELPLVEMDKALNRTILNYFIIVLIFILCFTVAILMFAHRSIHNPLSRIIDASKQVRLGNMNFRLDVAPTDLNDIREVEDAFNQMLESIAESNRELQKWSHDLEKKVLEKTEDLERTQTEIYHIERLASLGRLSSSVAHEINNPLAGVLTYAKLVSRLLENEAPSDEKRATILKHLNMIQSETTRCGNIVKGLLNFSRDNSPEFAIVNLNSILRETEQLIQHSFQISDITLDCNFAAVHDQIKANGNQIIQACLAVLTNALEAIDNSPNSQVTYSSHNPDPEHIVVEIRDNGIGIPAEDLEHIFEPFFSRKKEMSGIGLGLAVTYGILEQHNAKVVVDSSPGQGTSIKFIFELTDRMMDDEK
jgi:two-component system, NtrC family, sensor kinase